MGTNSYRKSEASPNGEKEPSAMRINAPWALQKPGTFSWFFCQDNSYQSCNCCLSSRPFFSSVSIPAGVISNIWPTWCVSPASRSRRTVPRTRKRGSLVCWATSSRVVGVVNVSRTDTPVDPKMSSDGRQAMFRPQLNRLFTKIPVLAIVSLAEPFWGSFNSPEH